MDCSVKAFLISLYVVSLVFLMQLYICFMREKVIQWKHSKVCCNHAWPYLDHLSSSGSQNLSLEVPSLSIAGGVM